MTAETEVSKEVVAIEEKCGSETSSSQDLPRSNCNGVSHSDQVNDPDNSYVFVSGADGLTDDPIDSKEQDVVAVAATGSTVEPESDVEVQNGKLNVLSGDVSEPVKEVQIGIVEVNEDTPVVSVGISPEQEKSPEDGTVADALGEQDSKSESRSVSDIKTFSDSNGSIGSTAGAYVETVTNHNEKIENVAESEINGAEVLNGGLESSVVTEMEAVTYQNRNLEIVEVTGIELVEAPNERIESSTITEIREGDHHNGNLQDEAKSVIEQARDAIETLESLEGSESEVVADPNENLENVAANDIKQVEDHNERIGSLTSSEIREDNHQNVNLQGEAKSDINQAENAIGTLESLEGSESEVVADPNQNLGNVAANDMKQVEDPNERLESLEGDEIEMVSDQHEKIECVAETELKEVENPNERLESLGEAEVETVRDQHEKIECAAETKIKEVGDPNGRPESSPEAEIEKMADQKKVADKKSEVAEEPEKVADQTNEGVAETEKVADQKSEGSAETETVADHENDGAAETEKVGDQINEGSVETGLQKIEDQIEIESSHAPVDNQECQVQDRGFLPKPEKDCELINSTLCFNESGNENDESGDQNNSDSTRMSGICEESQSVVEDPIESDLREVSNKGENEIKLAEELVETVHGKIPPATSLDTDIEAYPVNSNEKTLEQQENVALVSDVVENQKYETTPFVQGAPQQVDEEEIVVGGDDKQVETVCEVLEETLIKDISVSHVEDIAQNDEPEKPSENETQASPPTQSLAASYAHEPPSNIDVSGAETVSFSPVDSLKSEIVESGPSDQESHLTATTNDANSESNSVLGMVVSAEKEQTIVNDDVHVESDVSNVKPEVFISQPASVDVELESGLDVSKVESNIIVETASVEEMGDQLDSAKASTDETLSLQEKKDVENSQSDVISVSTDAIIEKETSIAAVTKPFNYLVRVPRFNNESLKERNRQAKLQIEENTKLRDAIQFQIQQIRANGQIHGIDYEYAKGEIRNARKLVRAKRVEIDSLHSVINKAKNAISIDDIDTRIYSMEHMMQHETLPLKEEKQFIREIKQLKSLRNELSSNMGSEDEIKQALEQREEAEERLKILRKELEKLKGEVSKAESAAMEAERKYEDENKKVKELQVQFRAANDVRQEAYAQWLSLRKELSEKNKHFFKYKDDTAAANNYAFSRDKGSLYRLCTDQVEKFMELWNTNEEFRKDYVNFNTRSTVRRFGTFDGRSLGPDEEPPILPSYVDESVQKVISTPAEIHSVSKSAVELKSEATVEHGTVSDKSTKKITENENQKVKSKKAAEPVLANGLATVYVPDEVLDEPVKSMEEIELDRKAEEMRRKEDESKLKEQRRLEGLAKANEARERKKRQAEKMQMRAELKARKVAEEKEKEREKRLRKKEKKKAGATDSNDGNNISDSAPSSESAIETVRDIDAKDMASVAAKRPQKITKQNKKNSSIPAQIRNRNKRKWQNYAYAVAGGILVFVLFWVGNIGMSSNKALKKPNPFY